MLLLFPLELTFFGWMSLACSSHASGVHALQEDGSGKGQGDGQTGTENNLWARGTKGVTWPPHSLVLIVRARGSLTGLEANPFSNNKNEHLPCLSLCTYFAHEFVVVLGVQLRWKNCNQISLKM